MNADTKKSARIPDAIVRRSAARLAASQVLYHIGISGGEQDAATALSQFSGQLLGNHAHSASEEMLNIEPDMAFLTQLVEGACQNQESIDETMRTHLSEKWRPERIDPVLKAILRAGIYELLHQPQTPARAIINEYTDVTAAFADEKDTGFVNGILDKIANSVRDGGQ